MTNNLAQVSYTRGNDLSGSLQGAGGIGGLLARTDNSLLVAGAASPHAYYHCDGNGNVTALVSTNGIMLARYSYDPYGNLLGISGPLAEANRYRFSSKEWNGNAGLYYYGYRFYDGGLQRWLERDPSGEYGGLNLYGYIGNNTINRQDAYGECPLANPMNAEAFSPGSTFLSGRPSDIGAREYLGFVGGAIAAYAAATATLGAAIEVLGPTVMGWLGLGGTSPQAQQVLQEAVRDGNALLDRIAKFEDAVFQAQMRLRIALAQLNQFPDKKSLGHISAEEQWRAAQTELMNAQRALARAKMCGD